MSVQVTSFCGIFQNRWVSLCIWRLEVDLQNISWELSLPLFIENVYNSLVKRVQLNHFNYLYRCLYWQQLLFAWVTHRCFLCYKLCHCVFFSFLTPRVGKQHWNNAHTEAELYSTTVCIWTCTSWLRGGDHLWSCRSSRITLTKETGLFLKKKMMESNWTPSWFKFFNIRFQWTLNLMHIYKRLLLNPSELFRKQSYVNWSVQATYLCKWFDLFLDKWVKVVLCTLSVCVMVVIPR